eukprot:14468305-Alexandrium_andersonii.AAC.1
MFPCAPLSSDDEAHAPRNFEASPGAVTPVPRRRMRHKTIPATGSSTSEGIEADTQERSALSLPLEASTLP